NCPACGNPVPADFKFCGTCGHRVATPQPSPGTLSTQPAPPSAQPAAQARGKLILINPDGSEGSAFPLVDGPNTIGRNAGKLFGGDAYLSPTHATFVLSGDGCSVRDEGSLNGVYIKIGRDRPVRLGHGDVFRIGQEILRFENMPAPQTADGV